MLTLLGLSFIIVSLLVSKKIYNTYFSPLSIFTLCWGGSTGLYGLKLINYNMYSTQYTLSFIITWFLFLLGTILSYKPLKKNNKMPNKDKRKLMGRPFFYVLSIINFLIIVLYGILNVYEFANGNVITYFQNSELIRIEFFKRSIYGNTLVISVLESLSYMCVGLAFISGTLSSMNNGIKMKIIGYLPLLSAFIFSTYYFARTPILLAFGFFILSKLISNLALYNKLILFKLNWKKILLAIIGLNIFNYIAYIRDDGMKKTFELTSNLTAFQLPENYLTTTIVSNYVYLTSSLANLQSYIDSGVKYNSATFGAVTFEPIYSMLNRLGIMDTESTSFSGQLIVQQSSLLYNLWGGEINLNTATAWDSIISDFGYTGLFIIHLLMGYISNKLFINIVYKNSISKLFQMYILVIIFYFILFSVFVNSISAYFKPFFLGLVIVFFYELLNRLKGSNGSSLGSCDQNI
ncbi:O-antigen polymerase [Guptibacillus algicola]|uniref:O-antigen polymerase n=1 Tax=Guptibacillus algicola TaxID=225844 RepID=UPI001CD37391|nr:O-antigen polymerase [Alkalihalobacillus algicola]MCA0987054.1 oligosaccharide repeat unit polymerase [Alkalihalobacillus algicola]